METKIEDENDDAILHIQPDVNIKIENDILENKTLVNLDESVKKESKVDLERFVRDAKLLDPEILSATIGPILNSKQSLWDVLVHKMNALETNEINKVVDCIQMVLNELRSLLIEVHGLMTSCCKENGKMGTLSKYSDQLSKCLTSDFFDKDHLEPKDVYEIPAYYLSMMLKSELQVKTEENQENHEFKEFDEPAIYDHEDDMDDLETKPLKLGKKRKYNKNKNKIKDTLKKRRPNVKDVPPDMKIAMADEEGICESRRRVYCDICTKGFGNQKRLDAHMTNGDCPGKPNPKWHYTNMTAKRLFCIHPECLGPNGFDINYLENSFNSGCIAKGYYSHVMDRHATAENSIFPCNTCSLKFPNTYILKYHKDNCGENFTCRYCGRGVSSKRLLIQHETSHNARALKCPHCDHATSRKYLLDMHIRTVHLNLRPEICQLCGKAFKTKKQIAAHILTHSDVKRYSCDICGAKLKNITCHRSHMMNVHGHKVSCDICGKFMYKEEGIRRHKKQEHGIDVFDPDK